MRTTRAWRRYDTPAEFALVNSMVVTLAGPLAELDLASAMINPAGDYPHAQRLARALHAAGLRFQRMNGEPAVPVAEQIATAEVRARHLGRRHQSVIRRVARALLEGQSLTGDEFRALTQASGRLVPQRGRP